MQRYSETKLANLCLTYKLSKLYINDDILVNAAHPGIVATNLLSINCVHFECLLNGVLLLNSFLLIAFAIFK